MQDIRPPDAGYLAGYSVQTGYFISGRKLSSQDPFKLTIIIYITVYRITGTEKKNRHMKKNTTTEKTIQNWYRNNLKLKRVPVRYLSYS
jgi:hypothetical protein